MSQRKEDFRPRALAILLGALLALVCHELPTDYQTACEAVAELVALSGCGV